MAGALFGRLKNWKRGENLLFADLNAEFNNLLINLKPAKIDDYSLNVSQMQETLDPGDVGSEVLATSLAEEVKQLRYMVKALSGESQWYGPPAAAISDLATSLNLPDNQLVSGLVNGNLQPAFVVPNGATNSVQLQGLSTNLVAFINGTRRVFIANSTASGLSLAPSADNTATVNYDGLAGQNFSKTLGEQDSVIAVDAVGSEITALAGKLAAYKVVHGGNTEYFVGEYDSTNSCFKNCFRGFFFDNLSAHIPRIAIHDNDTITLMKLTWVFATYNSDTEGIDVVYVQPTVSYDTPTSPNSGDYWFDLGSNTWKKYTGGAFVAQDAIWVGYCIQDTANCVAARTADFYKEYSDLNEVEIDRYSASVVRSRWRGARVSVMGTTFRLDPDNGSWSMGTDLDTGVSEAANTTYYCYIKSTGDRVLSDVPPHRRLQDLRGDYHPGKPYRCVGQIQNNSSQDFESTSSPGPKIFIPSYGQILNGAIRASVSANALTLTLTGSDGSDPSVANPVIATFRLGSGATGLWTARRITQPLSLVVPSSATLGLPSGTDHTPWLHAGLALVGAEVKLFASGEIPLVTGHSLISLYQMSSGSTTLYRPYGMVGSTQNNCPFVVLAKLKVPLATAGTWDTAPSKIIYDLTPKPPTTINGVGGSSGHGITNTKIRKFTTADFTSTDAYGDNTYKFVTTNGGGTVLTILEAGVYELTYLDNYSGGVNGFGISINSTQLTTDFASINAANQLHPPLVNNGTAQVLVKSTQWLVAGDQIRAHDQGNNDLAGTSLGIRRIMGIKPY